MRPHPVPGRSLAVALIVLAALVSVAAGSAAAAVATGSTAAAPAAGAPPVSIGLERREIAVSVGQAFDLGSTITNTSSEPLSGLIAHLDILSTDPDRYVDPEDWCTERTVFLDTLAPGAAVEHAWPMRAVDSGPLLVWVSVSEPSADAVALSPPARLTVGEHIDVNAEGVLPLVLGIPLLLLGSASALAWRRRHVTPARPGPSRRPERGGGMGGRGMSGEPPGV